MPQQSAKIRRSGTAEKYLGKTQYVLADNDFFEAWFAETTVKLTPNTPAPEQSARTVKITSAANELQSFQIVLAPKQSFMFKKISASDLKNGKSNISSENISMYALDYVPIKKKTFLLIKAISNSLNFRIRRDVL